MKKYYNIFLLFAFVLANLCVAQTTVYFSTITPGTETATLVPNGDFEQGSAGWVVVDDMYA